MKVKSLIPACALGVILFACAQKDSKSESSDEYIAAVRLGSPSSDTTGASIPAYDSLSNKAETRLKETLEGLLLRKSAHIDAQASEIPRTVANIEEIAALSGGYVVSSGITTDEISSLPAAPHGDSITSVLTQQQHGAVSIAVPASHFQELLGKLNGLSWKIEKRNITQDNVGLEMKKASLAQEEQRELANRQEGRTLKNSKHENVVESEFDKADLSAEAAREAHNHILDLNQEIAWSAVTISLTAPPETVVYKVLDPNALARRLVEEIHTDFTPWILALSLLLNALLAFQLYRQRTPYVAQA